MGLAQSGCWRFGCCYACNDNTWFVAHLSRTYCSGSGYKTVSSTRIAMVSRTHKSNMRIVLHPQIRKKIMRIIWKEPYKWLWFPESANRNQMQTSMCWIWRGNQPWTSFLVIAADYLVKISAVCVIFCASMLYH